MNEKNLIQSVQRASKILKYIGEYGPVKLNEICEACELKKSTVFGILQTLEYEGHIAKEKEGKAYRLGLTSLKLGLTYMNRESFDEKIHDILEQMIAAIDETVYFIMKIGTRYYYVDYILSSHPLKVMPEEGTYIEFPDHSAVGRVYSHKDDEDFKYGVDLEGVYEMTNCFAVPFKENGEIVGCVAFTGPSYRFTEEVMEHAYEAYLKIMKDLGHEDNL